MGIYLKQSNLLDGDCDAIVLAIDGMAPGLEGNIARAFKRKYPDAWEAIEPEISYPIPLGSVQLIRIDPDAGCPYSYCFLVSILNHVETLKDQQKKKNLARSLKQVLSLALQKQIFTICSPILSGGWRMDSIEAFLIMKDAYQESENIFIGVPNLYVHVLEQEVYRSIRILLEDH